MKKLVPCDLTLTLPGIAGRPGRPKKPDALTGAQRQALYRQRRKHLDFGETMSQTISRFAREFDLTEDQITRDLIRFALCNRNWAQTGFPSQVTEKVVCRSDVRSKKNAS